MPTATQRTIQPTVLPSVSAVSRDDVGTADAVVIGIRPSRTGVRLHKGSESITSALGGRLAAALRSMHATGREGEVITIPTLGLADVGVLVVVGLADASDEQVRRGVAAAIRASTRHRRVHVAIDAPPGAIAEGALLGAYQFTAYKSDQPSTVLRKITIGCDADAAARAELKRARIVATAVATTRDLVNTPPNDLYPATFAARVQALAGDADLDCEVLDEKALARGGYGGLVAVGSGSLRPPRLVRVAYRPARPRRRVALVGKGITFDSGGLNLKTANMTWMKSDMGGAAAAVACTIAAAALRLPLEVVATVPMAENMPGGAAYRPSDVLTMRNGTTVEVGDTDAEGRLVLGDAISRALDDKPDWLIEAATLTGGQLVALGTRVIGAMGEPGLRDLVTAAGNAAGESVWAMPLPEDLRSGLDSPVADLVNVPEDRWGSMLVAGHFLADFMSSDVPWVHLDIAGPAWNAGSARDYTPQGGTGAAVRTIIAALSELAAAH